PRIMQEPMQDPMQEPISEQATAIDQVSDDATIVANNVSLEQIASEVGRRRTFGIISHPDAGKTTLTEKLLLFSGAIQLAGAAKGVETQTIKLLNVCRMRNTPIITLMNKMDRETRDPLELLDELETVLKIQCAPVTWPIGMGKSFRGVYHLLRDEILLFAPGNEKADQAFEVIKGIDNPRLAEMFPLEIEQLKME